jgi:membrane-associated phospholipid phosphatase
MHKKEYGYKLIIILPVILFFIVNISYAQESNIEIAGDVVMLGVSSTAYGMTYYIDDQAGRTQFYKSFFTNLGLTYGLKLGINKERPDGSDHNSFPSAHTSVAFQSAAFIQKRYGWKKSIPAYLSAAFVGYSRVYADKHYVEDVLAGAAIGVLSAYYFTTPYKGVTISPIAGNGFWGINICKEW